MQLTITRPAAAPLSIRISRTLTAWKEARARAADERLIQAHIDRLSRLGPHFLDDIGLAHLSSQPQSDTWYKVFMRFPRA